MEPGTLSLTHSPFIRVAIGLFGLGAGYFSTAIHLALGSAA